MRHIERLPATPRGWTALGILWYFSSMRIGIKDRKVIRAFTDKQAAEGHKLSSDGRSLDGHWMGGARIAEWVHGSRGEQIACHVQGSRARQTVCRAVRREAAPIDMLDYKGIKR